MTKQAKVLLALVGGATDANGAWFDVSEFEFPLAVLTVGSGAGDTIIINATDQLVFTAGPAGSQGSWGPPANTVHDQQLASLTADAVTYINGPVYFIKVRKPAATASSTVYVLGRVKKS